MTGVQIGIHATTVQLSKVSFTSRAVTLSVVRVVGVSDSTATVSLARKTMPNPSIERTANGLRPLAASHVKR